MSEKNNTAKVDRARLLDLLKRSQKYLNDLQSEILGEPEVGLSDDKDLTELCKEIKMAVEGKREAPRKPIKFQHGAFPCLQKESDNDVILPYHKGDDIFIRRVNPEQKTVSDIVTNVQRLAYRHSPSGFNFGYGGSGPADTALNICLMFASVSSYVTPRIYQELKRSVIAGHDEGKEHILTINPTHIVAFLTFRGIAVRHDLHDLDVEPLPFDDLPDWVFRSEAQNYVCLHQS